MQLAPPSAGPGKWKAFWGRPGVSAPRPLVLSYLKTPLQRARAEVQLHFGFSMCTNDNDQATSQQNPPGDRQSHSAGSPRPLPRGLALGLPDIRKPLSA